MLSLQAMFLIMIMLVASSSGLSMRRRMSRNIILIALDLLLIHIIQDLNAQLNIAQKLITSALAEILTNHHSQHLQIIRMRRHRIRRHNPTSATQLMSERKFIVVLLAGLEAECDQWESLAVLLRHDDEAELLEGVGEVVCGAG